MVTPSGGVSEDAIISDETNLLDNRIYRQLGIFIIHAFAVFAALSAVLGRIYMKSYAAELGIPESAFRLDVVNYAIVSPDVVFATIGIATGTSLYTWWTLSRRRSYSWSWKRFATGLVLFLLGLAGLVASQVLKRLFGVELGHLGIAWALSFALYMGGAALAWPPILGKATMWIAGILSRWGSSKRKRSKRVLASGQVAEAEQFVRLLIPILVGLMLLVAVNTSIGLASDIGILQAKADRENSPQAIVEFDSSRTNIPSAALETDEGMLSGLFGVVLLSEEFVYLTSVNKENNGNEYRVFSFPLDDIVSIAYLND